MNKKEEAVWRMEKLGLMKKIIGEFKRSDTLYYSERTPLGGILYWMDNEPEWGKLVKKFEQEFDALVYHATHEYTEFGELLDLLFIPDYTDADTEEWESDRRDMEDGYVYAYVINLSEPMFSEFGTIVVKERAGGLVRVG